jgi:hypothetical protein
MTAAATDCHVLVERTSWTDTPVDRREIRAFSTCRNERLRLPAFLAHYRRLGVDRFVIVDNNSSDGTTEYLASQPDVQLFLTAGRYSESKNGTAWMNALLAQFGVGLWSVTVDIDELLVYPGSEQVSLRGLTAHLEQGGYDALCCLLLDLYPAGPLKTCTYKAGEDLIAAAPYFDAGPYERIPVDLCPGILIRGGMRERVFYPEFRTRNFGVKLYEAMRGRAARRAPFLHDVPWLRARRGRTPPVLTKVPLVRWDSQSQYLHSTHWVSRKTVAPDTGALLHFKYLSDFHSRALEEASRAEHHDDGAEYRRYADRLGRDPDLTLMFEGSIRYENTAQLVRLGLMRDIADSKDAQGEGTS